MKKGDYIEYLFNQIKDEIEFDSDVIALESLLNLMLDLDFKKAIINWKYILKKYDIFNLSLDINFTPILHDFSLNIIMKKGLIIFFEVIEDLSETCKLLIFEKIFNIFDLKCVVYSILEKLIIKEDYNKEFEIINLVINKISNIKIFFDFRKFLREIIFLHINNNKINLLFLDKITELPLNPKDRAVLKTLLIKYKY